MPSTRTRILFVTPPGYGNVFPIVPLAWAARTQGCDVLVATGGRTVAAVSSAGLPVIDVSRGIDLAPIYRTHKDSFFAPAANTSDTEAPLPGTSRLFMTLADAMAEATLSAAQAWRPDVIVHHPDAAAAPIVAARLGLPAVFLGIGLAQTPDVMRDGLYADMIETCGRLGVDAIPPPVVWIDVAPPGLRRLPAASPVHWPMQYVPFNAASEVTADAFARPSRPLIAVTLGTVVPILQGLRPLRQIARAAGSLDADFIVTLGIDPVGAGRAEEDRVVAKFPPNVTSVPWQPFDLLFARCHAVIHHGGAGTLLTALAAGLPQLILPRGSDHFYNAAVLARSGAALVLDEPALDDGLLQRLLDPSGPMAAAAARLRAEMVAMPTPNDVARRLVALAAP